MDMIEHQILDLLEGKTRFETGWFTGELVSDTWFFSKRGAYSQRAFKYLQDKMNKAKPKVVSDVIEMIQDEPEYQHQASLQAPPMQVSGKKTTRCGNVFVSMTGGVMPKEQALDELSRSGISTLVVMHIPEEALAVARKTRLNVVIAGHMASVGMAVARAMRSAKLPPKEKPIRPLVG